MNTTRQQHTTPSLRRLISGGTSGGKRTFIISLDKRQKFVISVIFLSLSLFVTEYQFGKSFGVYIVLALSIICDLFLYWAIRRDVKENFTLNLFILPFFYSLAFGLFYFLIPARLYARFILTLLYAFGLYSLFLSQNIFTVSSIRTIQLLSGARIVSFVITLISFFFLSNIALTLHLHVVPFLMLIFVYTFALIYHSIWTYTLQKSFYASALWTLALTATLTEVAAILWFWPSSPTVLALFLTGFFYTIVGLSHVWFERRLFKGVMWEYVWVGVVVFFVLNLFTQWGN
jgi:hypothetical protein